MSARLTSIELPGCVGSGFSDWGRKTPAEMIAQLRENATITKTVVDAILAAADNDFRVETHTGVVVRRNKTILQPGRAARKDAS